MAIWLKFRGYIVAAVSTVLASLSIYFIGRRSGAKDEQIKRERADFRQSRKIQDKADAVRRAADKPPAIDRLRRYKRLRDWSDDMS